MAAEECVGCGQGGRQPVGPSLGRLGAGYAAPLATGCQCPDLCDMEEGQRTEGYQYVDFDKRSDVRRGQGLDPGGVGALDVAAWLEPTVGCRAE